VTAGAFCGYHRSMPAARRFPPPWIVEEHNNACFVVRDATGQAPGISISRRSSVGARRPSCSPRTRPAAWRQTKPSCRSLRERSNRRVTVTTLTPRSQSPSAWQAEAKRRRLGAAGGGRRAAATTRMFCCTRVRRQVARRQITPSASGGALSPRGTQPQRGESNILIVAVIVAILLWVLPDDAAAAASLAWGGSGLGYGYEA